MSDTNPERDLERPGPHPSPWVLLDVPPSTGGLLPVDPEFFDMVVSRLTDDPPTREAGKRS
ncbi:hypothetical protein [Streptomyces sp. ISL-86]|uniref:hypothetical protein n=1 Tax=Streptomyces sp. ISL-86 TaxID=2819187 RepID=UPI001BE93F46|nr:hypothetical protein [Streptomyces sp. ISL-86]MBT2459897.1 hypothetical protein [Streptomyces sp. ISL-86]